MRSEAPLLIPPGRSIYGDPNVRHPAADILNCIGFYDQNSHVMPDTLREGRGVLADGLEDEWVEYVPTSYDGTKAVPLVISRHGGGQSGWGQCYATSWMHVAEQEGFIVAFPTSSLGPPPRRDPSEEPSVESHPMMTLDPASHDVALALGLIEDLAARYAIDRTRIYCQGMSMGDLMTMRLARTHGHLLAGIALAAGPSPIEALFDRDGGRRADDGPVPCYQARGERDVMAISKGYDGQATRYDINEANKRFWIQADGCDAVPLIRIEGRNNFEFYLGRDMDVVVRDVKDRGHGQTFDDARYAWDLCFSRYARVDGRIVRLAAPDRGYGDAAAVAVATGCRKAYVADTRIDLGLPAFTLEEPQPPADLHLPAPTFAPRPMVYVPAGFLATAFGCSVEERAGGRAVRVTTPAGRVVEISEGNVGVVLDGKVAAMWRQAEMAEGRLCVPFQWFASEVAGAFVTECDGAVYASDHYGEMTAYMARTIREKVLG